VDFDTEGRDVLLLEFTSQMALHESGLDSRRVSKDGVESWRPVTGVLSASKA
jgi:hypothetical protein